MPPLSTTRLLLAGGLLFLSAFASGAAITTRQNGLFSDPGTWTGGVVPSSADDVTIDHFVAVQAVDAVAKNLTVSGSGSLVLYGRTIICGGNLTTLGSVMGGSFLLKGSASSISGSFESDLNLETSHTISTTRPIQIAVLMHNGALDVTSADITISGFLLSRAPVTGKVKYAPGAGLQLHFPAGAHAPGDQWPMNPSSSDFSPGEVGIYAGSGIRLPGTGTDIYPVKPGGTIVIDGLGSASPVLDLGDASISAASIQVGENATLRYRNNNLTVPLVLSATGVAICEHTVLEAGTYTAPTLGASVRVTNLSSTGTLTIERRDQNHPAAAPGQMTGRWYNIHTTAPNVTANVTLNYSHLGGMIDPYVCHYDGTSWNFGRSSRTTSEVTWNGITSFSPFALGNALLGPLPVSLSRLSTE